MIVLPDTIKEIVVNKLSGSITPEEEKMLEEWRLQSDAHDQELIRYNALWAASGAARLQSDFDTATAWLRMDQQLRSRGAVADTGMQMPRRMKVIRRYVKPAMVAAVAAVVILIGWFLLHKPDTKIPAEVVSAGKNNIYIRLPDSSLVLLRKGGTISYNAAFGRKNRQIVLTGDALFEISNNDRLPFNVQTERSLVKVLGTSFVISTIAQNDRVVVMTGKVLFSMKAAPENHCIVAAQEEVTCTGGNFEKRNVSDDNYLSWKTNVLTFNDTPLEKAVADISSYYRITVKLGDALKGKTIRVTSSFREQPLQEVLDEITAITGLHYRKIENTVVIY